MYPIRFRSIILSIYTLHPTTFKKRLLLDSIEYCLRPSGDPLPKPFGILYAMTGIDYLSVAYALVTRISAIRLLIAMASIHNLIIHQMDVKTTFLNGELDEEDMREADVILSIRIKHESKWISISLSYYIEEVLKKFIYFECTPVSTPMDTSEKLMPNNGRLLLIIFTLIWAPTTNNLKKDYIGCCAMKLIDNIQTKSFNTFAKLYKFKGVDFRRWQKKMQFLLSNMSVVYVPTTPIPEDSGDDATVKQIRKRAK
ncbi:zinc finger, CCHC-type containing protein [Tanacetum coccineum]|uniref:Zinc finger, CCHC-type containing protein n=1 Tax=Tanacetum coccineum TaxID=301880 RepID=A0ABQ5DS85_9ASTR